MSINLSLFKNFAVRERNHLQLRWEAFNVLNHTNLKLPVIYVNAPNAGTIQSANDPRLMQVAVRYQF
jgi:hypothetical protein